jgi:hypothetical protein
MHARAPGVLLVVALAGCEERGRETRDPAEPAPAAVASQLAVDASGLVGSIDPPAPAGDLKAELDRFVNLDTCVAERARLDPLIGDALGAIGYDTFLRDACRLLEATKDKKRETCDRIDSSALKRKCQSWVAMVMQSPDACPMVLDSVATRGRLPSCVAVAAKDARLCAAEGRAAARATCEGLTSRDDSRCDVLLPHDRPGCKREIARWRSMLPAPLEGLTKLAAARGKLTVRGHDGTADPNPSEIDVGGELTRGAVVVTSRERARVELGTVGESEAARIAPTPQKRPRVGLAVLLEPGGDAPKPVLQRFELEIPGEATLVHPGARCECKVTTARIDKTRGGEVVIAVQGTIGLGTRSYKVDVELGTFVRDVVAEQATARVLPPVHPTLGGLGLDAGR